VKSGEDLETIHGHSGIILACGYSPDGKYIASGSGDKTAKLWDAFNFAMLKTFSAHTHEITAISFFSEKGNEKTTHLVTSSSDCSVRIWDIDFGAQTCVYFCQYAAMSLSTIADYQTVCVGDSMGQLSVLEIVQPEIEIFHLDIRVGKFVQIVKHETAEKLYVADLDVGELIPRKVITGLAQKIPEKKLSGKLVCVLCNLRPARIAGILSNGMLLGAASSDNSKVELVCPPQGSVPGERIRFEGYTGDPLAVVDISQKKRLELFLKTNSKCQATYKDVRWMSSAGACSVESMANSAVN